MKAFGSYHPFVLAVYFLAVLLIAIFLFDPIIQFSALLGAVMFCFVLLGRKKTLRSMGIYLLLFCAVAVTNPLFSHNGTTPLFFLNGNPVTLEACIYGAVLGLAVIAIIIWFNCYNEIMTSDKFLYLFGKAIPKLSIIISMALRFVPMFIRQAKRINNVQKTMGIYSGDGYLDRIKSVMRVFSATVSWVFENAIDTASSMNARGYGNRHRSNFSLFKFRSRDAVLLFICILLTAITLCGSALGKLDFRFYPSINLPEVSLMSVSAYIAFAVLCLIPFIIELKEALVWKYCISKI